jgi:Bacterial Ig domain/Lectin C-type domain/FG-GAP-like repeat
MREMLALSPPTSDLGTVNQVVYIEVPNISAKVGDIEVTGDYLTGSGKLNAPGDAKIRITNNSPYYLRVNSLVIPEIQGGRILFNYLEVTDNATINQRNADGYSANFSQVTTHENSPEALIEVENTYDPTFAVQKAEFAALGAATPAAPDLEIIGAVDNLKGTIHLANDEGSVVVRGKLNGKTIDIDSGKDFVLNNLGQVLDFNPTHSVNLSQNTITLANHGLKTGDRIFYSNQGGTSLAGLSHQRSYFAIVTGTNTIKLAATQAQAQSQTAIDLTSLGSGSQHRFSLTDDLGFFHVGGDPRAQLASTAQKFEIGAVSSGTSSVNPSSTSSIIASNNVLINARYLNINGLIQSGVPDRNLTLNSDLALITKILDFKETYNSLKRLGSHPNPYLTLKEDLDDTSIEAKYNAETNRIEIDNIDIQGGYMQLVGHMLSTGNGKLQVLDGFGKVNIINNTNYDLALNAIDTGGQGIEGRLELVDTAKTGADGSPLVTTYTRLGNTITTTDNSIVGGKTTTQSNTRTTSYNPLANQRYTWVTGQASIKETQKTYAKSEFWGSDDLSKDPDDTVEERSILLDKTPLLEGAYVENKALVSKYVYQREINNTSESELIDQDTWTETSGWWIFKETTYYRRDTYQQGQKTINTHSYDADSPISIQFIGYDSGSVNVQTNRSLLLLDNLNNFGGTTTLTTTQGTITNLSTHGTIISNRLTLSGNTLEHLSTDVNQLQFMANGDVEICDRNGNLTLSGESYSNYGNINLSVEGSLLSTGTGSYDIKGYTIDLSAQTGSLGAQNRALRVDSGAGSTLALNAVDGQSGLSLQADDNIYLREIAGDLYLVKATAGNDVVLSVANGNLFDNNLTESLDPYSQTQLETLWANAGLTQNRSAEAIQSFKQQASYLYDTYWNYRNITPRLNAQGQITYSADAYDPNFTYRHSDTAISQLRALGYSDREITDIASQKSQEYHTLHQLFSGQTISETTETASMATVIRDLFLDSDFTGKNLTQLTTYHPDLIDQNYTVSNSQQQRLSQGSQWSIEQLKNTVTKGFFGAITDTQYTIEAANIQAQGNVTVTTSGAMGRSEGAIVINNWASVKNWATDLTQEQRLALSYAERDDLTYYDATGNRIDNPTQSNQAIASIVINRKQDIDIDAQGELNLTAGGHIFLGSEQDLNLDQVKAGSEVRIKAAQGIYDVAITDVTNIVGTDLILEAGSASIGTSNKAITIDLADKTYYRNGKLYLLSQTDTWESSQAYAQSLGGNLVTVNDATEEQWLKTTFGTTENFWIGLTDNVTEGQFVWANGETVNYRNWAPGDPNNVNDEDYVTMNFSDSRQWNDVNSTTTRRGIIELTVQEHDGHFYLVNPTATWENAQKAAQVLGGNLVTVNDAAEEQWLKTTFGTSEAFWIGLTDKVTEGQFVWANGETTTYRNWAPGEPNNSNNEDYISMNFGTNRQWNDANSTISLSGIVEISALGSALTARAKENLYIANVNGALNLDHIYAGDIASLASSDAIYDANHDGASNIQADTVMLTATSVGLETDAMDLNLNAEATLQLQTTHNVYLKTLGNLRVDVAQRKNGTLSILGNDNPNIITLTSSNDALRSASAITIDGKGGQDTLIVEPTRADGNWNVSDRSISGTGLGPISYTSTEKVIITPIAGKDFVSTTESAAVNISPLSNDKDFVLTNAIQITALNGISLSAGSTVTLASGAQVTFNTNNSFTYNPNGQFEWLSLGQTLRDSFTYSVTNASGGTDTATVEVTLTGTNDTPISRTDTATTDEATAITIAVLNNDFDIDRNDSLRITHLNDATITAGNPFAFASGARVTLNANGTLSYNPNGQFEGLGVGQTAIESFTYTVSDNNGSTSTETVTLTLYGINDDIITQADHVSTDENTALTFAALSNDTDIDLDDTLTITQVNGLALNPGTSVTLGSKAKLTLNANGTFTYNPSGQFNWLGVGQQTQESFTYTVTDNQGSTRNETVTLTITGVNDGPVANLDNVTTNEDASTTIAVLNNDRDADQGDVITITRVNGTAISPGSTIKLTSGALLTLNSNQTFTYNPNGKFSSLHLNESAIDRFTYTISDGKSTSTANVAILIKGLTFREYTGAANPFQGIDVGNMATPALFDIDSDGDLDAFMGAADGTIRFYRNTDGVYSQVTGSSNPFNGRDLGNNSSITFADFDRDGDLDAFIGGSSGFVSYFKNDNGTFTYAPSASPFRDMTNILRAPLFADIDNDGDLDALLTTTSWALAFYRNTGSGLSQVTGTVNPFNNISITSNSRYTLADLDGDGDLDLVVNDGLATLSEYRNTNGSFSLVSPTDSRLSNIRGVMQGDAIAFFDQDSDGDLDLLIGKADGTIKYWENQ